MNLNELTIIKWESDFGGVSPTLDINSVLGDKTSVSVGDEAYDTGTGKQWKCTDNTAENPVWVEMNVVIPEVQAGHRIKNGDTELSETPVLNYNDEDFEVENIVIPLSELKLDLRFEGDINDKSRYKNTGSILYYSDDTNSVTFDTSQKVHGDSGLSISNQFSGIKFDVSESFNITNNADFVIEFHFTYVIPTTCAIYTLYKDDDNYLQVNYTSTSIQLLVKIGGVELINNTVTGMDNLGMDFAFYRIVKSGNDIYIYKNTEKQIIDTATAVNLSEAMPDLTDAKAYIGSAKVDTETIAQTGFWGYMDTFKLFVGTDLDSTTETIEIPAETPPVATEIETETKVNLKPVAVTEKISVDCTVKTVVPNHLSWIEARDLFSLSNDDEIILDTPRYALPTHDDWGADKCPGSRFKFYNNAFEYIDKIGFGKTIKTTIEYFPYFPSYYQTMADNKWGSVVSEICTADTILRIPISAPYGEGEIPPNGLLMIDCSSDCKDNWKIKVLPVKLPIDAIYEVGETPTAETRYYSKDNEGQITYSYEYDGCTATEFLDRGDLFYNKADNLWYIYNGTTVETLHTQGADGADGADGTDGQDLINTYSSLTVTGDEITIADENIYQINV